MKEDILSEVREAVVGVDGMITSQPQVKTLLSTIIGVAAFFSKTLNELFVIFVLFMWLDWITGVTAAYICKELSSRKGYVGILKKVMMLTLVVLSILLDNVSASTFNMMKPIFYTMITSWLIANEGLSILENIGRCGVPIPKGLVKALTALKKKGL